MSTSDPSSQQPPAPYPTRDGQAPIVQLLGAFPSFAHVQSLSGIVLMAASVLALAIANSPWHAAYDALLHLPLRIEVADFALELDLLHWINDALMAVFFLVVGLEIKRELVVGELAGIRKAALPIAAAAGGMIVPALIYAAFNRGTPTIQGWGVPIATDIAFALGILALLGRRVPLGLKIFLTALAIIDDIGAVLVIALFYTASVSGQALFGAGIVLALLLVLNRLGVHSRAPYGALGLCLWFFVLLSGVHATIAGVLLAMTIPVRARIDAQDFVDDVSDALSAFQAGGQMGDDVPTTIEQRSAIRRIEETADHATSPLHRVEDALHVWSAYAILPIFALANAGVRVVDLDVAAAIVNPITLGIVLGLFLGKVIGILAMSRLAVRSGLAELPDGVTWRHVLGAGFLAGIGFTMSLFISNLAFQDPASITAAKLGILLGSLASGVLGYLVLLPTTDAPGERASTA